MHSNANHSVQSAQTSLKRNDVSLYELVERLRLVLHVIGSSKWMNVPGRMCGRICVSTSRVDEYKSASMTMTSTSFGGD
jgi:hypothetical protein